MIQALRGMKDILPPQSEKYLYFIQECSKILDKYGFKFIETPTLEESKLYIRSVGESSDIIGKEMYQFIDKGGNNISLRPEGTAGVVRSFIENKFDKAGGIYRFYYHGSMFRYERPQKGRLREFHQFGVESFGIDSFYEDVLIISMLKKILDKFNIKYTLKINSLGCDECMPPYKKNLINFLEKETNLCADCLRRKETNPIRVFDCKNTKCQEILQNAPRLKSHLCKKCDTNFNNILELLEKLEIKYEVDLNLVRGLDYYTQTAFEFTSDQLGAQSAVAGGGRYDKLVGSLGGENTPAIGFAIGIERILEMIELPEKDRDGYYFGALCDKALAKLFIEADKKREQNRVLIEYRVRNLKKHLKAADKAGVRYCVIIGEDELKNNQMWIKDLVEKSENKISFE